MGTANDTPLDPTKLEPPVQQGTPGQDVAMVTARRAKAIGLRIAGMTYAEIAKECGYTDKSAARMAVVAALDSVLVDGVEHLRTLEAARLDRLQAAVWPLALRGDLRAVRVAVRISERRSKLLGLDAPILVEISDGIDQELQTLAAALADDGSYTVTSMAEPDDG